MSERDLVVITAAILLTNQQSNNSVSLAISMAEELISFVEHRQRTIAEQRGENLR